MSSLQVIKGTADSFTTFIQHMSINHGGINILVPHKFLNRTNIITAHEQMCCKDSG
jgi:hypothetical protein